MHRIRFAIVVALCCLSAMAVEPAEIDRAVAAITQVEFGQSRAPLQRIDELVRATDADAAQRQRLADALAGLLDAENTYHCRQFACRKLAQIGTARQVPLLARWLADPEMGPMARYSLEQIPGPEADAALIAALAQAPHDLRIGLVNSLGVRRSAAAVDALTALLADASIELSRAAAAALGHIGSDAAVDALLAAFENAPEQRRAFLAHACLDGAACLLSAGRGANAAAIYARVRNHPGASDVCRARALRGLVGLAEPATAVAEVLAGLQDSAQPVQRMAVRLARGIPGTQATRAFAQALGGLPGPAQVALLSVLADRADQAALGVVVAACDSYDTPVRVAALLALGKLGNSTHIPLLAERAAAAQGEEAQAARLALQALPVENLDDRLLDHVADPRPAVQVELIEALAQRHAVNAAPALLRLTDSDQRPVRQAAWKALREVATLDHFDALLAALGRAGRGELSRAQRALASVVHNQRDQLADTQVESLVQAFRVTDDPATRAALLTVLTAVGNQSALAVLAEVLAGTDAELRTAALRQLGQWPDSAPLPLLAETVTRTSDTTERILALRAFVRAVGLADDLAPAEKTVRYRQALGWADTADEKKLALAGLAATNCPEAFDAVAALVDDPALRAEARVATVQLADALAWTTPQRVAAVLDRIAQDTSDPAVLQKIDQVRAKIDELGSYLTRWTISLPYRLDVEDFDQLFESAFAPERRAPDLGWEPIAAGTNAQYPFLVEIDRRDPGTFRVAYLRCQVHAPSDRTAHVELGSDDSVKVWVNGVLVHALHAGRGFAPAQDRFTVDLHQGWNTIMVKVVQWHSGWNLAMALKRPDGSRMDDLEVQPVVDEANLPRAFAATRPQEGSVVDVPAGLRFEKRRLDGLTYEAASAFDVDRDGHLDIVSGEFWLPGPDFTRRHRICELQVVGDYYDDFCDYPMDVNGDGYLDLVTGAWFTGTVRWRENPAGRPQPWPEHTIDACGNIETIRCWDIDGDGQVEVVPNLPGGPLVAYELVRDEQGRPAGTFRKHVLRTENQGHGLGFGDLNGDGRGDFVLAGGWLEAPAEAFRQPWTWHGAFNLGSTSVPILVHDVDNDGRADLIEGQGHGYGLNWWRQDETGGWTRHPIDTLASQYHDMQLADIDNDGDMELLTGKRYRAHSGHDPGADDPLGIYYLEISDGSFRRASIDFGPAATASGAGIYFWVADVDANGWLDVLAPGKEGLYLFSNFGPLAIP